MAENENRTVWPVTLYQNQMTERTDDYSARVKTFDDPKDLEYVVNEVIADGTEFKKQTLIDIYTRIEAKIRALVRQGYPVQTDNVRFGPSVEGSFSGEGLPLEDSEIKCTLNLTATETMQKALENVTYHVDGVQEDGGAAILSFKNLTTGATDGSVNRTDFVEARGKKIKAVNQDGTGIGKVDLVSVLGVATTIESLPYNDPSRIAFNIPEDLAEGEYTLQIETYYAAGNKLLKEPRVLVYSKPITIS